MGAPGVKDSVNCLSDARNCVDIVKETDTTE
jgi:hypothetical protein